MQHESFLPIKGYEGLYEVSNLGRIKALQKTIEIGFGRVQFYPERIMKANIASNGYLMVRLTIDRVSKSFTVHRLVGLHFVANPNGYKVLNHKDGNKLNPSAENLEWTTYSKNEIHAYAIGLKRGAWKGKFNKDHHLTKPVIQFDLNGNVIKEWESANLAAEAFGIQSRGIQHVSRGVNRSYKGFIWKYKNAI